MATLPIGQRRHRVAVQNPTPPVPDGDGGYTQSWVDADPPALFVRIRPASAQDLERSQSGTVIAMGTHVIVGPYHAHVSTETRLTYSEGGRTHVFQVLGCSSPDLRCIDTAMLVAEIVT